jgi:phosphoribosyl 1,2-cyclic phosphate phosphodiesterase
MTPHSIRKKFLISKKNSIINIEPFNVQHGMIKATGYLFDKIAYISDCNQISKKIAKKLINLDFLIIDCLRINKHPSHFNYDDAINFIKLVKPKKAILTNLNIDLDYYKLKKKLPKNIIPAFDGLSFNF